ncbi:MAG: DUF370 domain-containing protein [Clostridia bacterium]|jgi:hypothetical protein|nr:DUF370 domain-containing protein [Clostridia bacterium]MDD3972713.1 DUF370 domain-containing protein [Clostridia bacterium]MDD4544182.1 DUF370 domain-containing protein [Clostridia bacterium]NLF35765.1 DUF370 domain-containing protein [Clostridiaceae bacterium]
MKFLNIGFGNMVSMERIVAVLSPESAPVKRIIQEARDTSLLIDATYGRRTRSVIITDSEHIILSPLQPETLERRLSGKIVPDDINEDSND